MSTGPTDMAKCENPDPLYRTRFRNMVFHSGTYSNDDMIESLKILSTFRIYGLKFILSISSS